MRSGRLLLLALLGVLAWGFHTLWLGGAFRSVERDFEGECVAVRGVPGPEDLTLHPSRPIAYVSGFDRPGVAAGRPARGGLWAYDLSGEAPGSLVNLTPDASPDFRPHGVSLFVGSDGAARLFVIDHEGGGDAIRVYDVVGDDLEFVESFEHPLIGAANDLVAVGPREFYVSNDHRWSEGWRSTAENWLRLPVSNVIHFDGRGEGEGDGFRVAAAGISFPNGINVSADGRTLYVASTLGRELLVYRRDPASGALTRSERIALGTAPDNIERDAEGALWIGAHPKLLALPGYMAGKTAEAPSQVLRVTPAPESATVEQVYLDSGVELSASSVAAVRDGRMLIGAIRAGHFLDCRLP